MIFNNDNQIYSYINDCFNINENKKLFSSEISNTKKAKRFLGLGIAGIIMNTAGIVVGVPCIIATIYLNQYNNSDVGLAQSLGVKPFSLGLMLITGAFSVIASVASLLGIIFIIIGFANYAENKKKKDVAIFIDNKKDDLRIGLSFKLLNM